MKVTDIKGLELVKIPGTNRSYKVVSEGVEVPHIALVGDDESGYHVTVDERFCTHNPIPVNEISPYLFILANGMAVAEGYPCHRMRAELSVAVPA